MSDRIVQLQYGDEIFDLNSVGLQEGISLIDGGGGSWSFAPQRHDAIVRSERVELSEERFELAFWAKRHTDLTARMSRLWKILRAAWRFTFTDRQRTPVYIVFQTKGCGEPQYALLHSSPQVSGSSPIGASSFDSFFRAVQDTGLVLLHYPWLNGPPGELPALTTLVATDGPADPTRCFVANFRDTVDVTHVFNYDDSGAAFSANLFDQTGWTVWAAVPAAGDILYIGNDTPRSWHHWLASIATAGDYDADVTIEYSIAELFANAGFETAGGGGADIWASWVETAGDGALANEIVNVHSGSDAARLTSGPTSNTKIAQSITVVPGRIYEISFWARGDGVNAGRYLVFDVTNAVNIVATTSTGVTAAAYSKVTVRVTAPAGCVSMRLDLMCPPVNAAICYFDDVLPSTWATAPDDIKCTLFPSGGASEIFKRIGDWAINPGALPDWASAAVNAVTAYWLRVKIDAVTVMTTAPVMGAQVPYTQKKNYVEIPATAVAGDTLPVCLMRLFSPYGGDDDESFANLSRIAMGAKSEDPDSFEDLDLFEASLNWSDEGNPAGWACATGTDGAFAADPLAPTGRCLSVDFATDTSLTVRGTLTGTAKLRPWVGPYRVYLRCRQVGGAAGDCSVALYTRLLGSSAINPATRSKTYALGMVDTDDIEVVDMGELTLPFVKLHASDELSSIDLIFQIYAQRSTGAATLQIYDLFLQPLNEWSNAPWDPLTDTTYGSSALRGNTMLEMDGGIVRPRVQKMYVPASGDPSPMELWHNGGPFLRLQPGTRYRIYFMLLHYRSGGQWGSGPWAANLGAMLAFELYIRNRYLLLRGEG